jgi:hypothetical protein
LNAANERITCTGRRSGQGLRTIIHPRGSSNTGPRSSRTYSRNANENYALQDSFSDEGSSINGFRESAAGSDAATAASRIRIACSRTITIRLSYEAVELRHGRGPVCRSQRTRLAEKRTRFNALLAVDRGAASRIAFTVRTSQAVSAFRSLALR